MKPYLVDDGGSPAPGAGRRRSLAGVRCSLGLSGHCAWASGCCASAPYVVDRRRRDGLGPARRSRSARRLFLLTRGDVLFLAALSAVGAILSCTQVRAADLVPAG